MGLRAVAALFSIAIMALPVAAAGQNYPNKPVRIVTAEAGSGADLVARLLAQELTDSLGQQVIVDNRPGGSGIIAAMAVIKSPPDGYTMLAYGNPLWLLPFLQDNVPFDPVRDFAPITVAASAPNVLVVHPSVPANSVRELIALAKAKPGSLNYASGPTGGSPHLAAELFKAMAGVNIVNVPYKGTATAINDVIGGHVQLMFPNGGSVAPHVRSGRLRALAVTSAQSSALLPGVPTLASSGLPGYESASILGLYAPAGTPATLVARLHQEIANVLNRPDVKEKFFNTGLVVVGNSPEQLAAMMKSEMAKWGKLIREVGIRGE